MDLNWRFHQIVLAKESRHVKTFVTHRGLYRYTHLMFGVTSAAEKYQQIISDVLRGCEGVINIAEDLQSRTKVLGTVLQYSYFSVVSRFPLKTVHPFRNFLAVLPPPTLYKVETRKKFWIHASNIVCGVRGGVGPV